MDHSNHKEIKIDDLNTGKLYKITPYISTYMLVFRHNELHVSKITLEVEYLLIKLNTGLIVFSTKDKKIMTEFLNKWYAYEVKNPFSVVT